MLNFYWLLKNVKNPEINKLLQWKENVSFSFKLITL